MANNEVAMVIAEQLGGLGKLRMMLGAKDFVADANKLQFKVGKNAKKISCVVITLDPSDTYTVQFYQGYSVNMALRAEVSDVYADSLKTVIESHTGMYLDLFARR